MTLRRLWKVEPGNRIAWRDPDGAIVTTEVRSRWFELGGDAVLVSRELTEDDLRVAPAAPAIPPDAVIIDGTTYVRGELQ